MLRSSTIPAFLLASTLAPSLAIGQSLNLDVGVTGGLPAFIYPGALPQTGVWNEVDPHLPGALVGLDGMPVAVTLAATGFGAEVFHPAHGGYNGRLVNDGFAVEGVSTWRFDGLEAGEYEIATFAWEPILQQERLTVEVVGSPDGTLEVGEPVQCSTLRGSHARHRVVSTGTIEIVVRELGIAGTVNAIQLRRVRDGSGPSPLTFVAPPSSAPNAGFRAVVSLFHDTAVFTEFDSAVRDRVHIYRRGPDGWIRGEELAIGQERLYYGNDLALGAGTCLVGSPTYFDPLLGSSVPGEVHVFEEEVSGWSHAQVIASPGAVTDEFGQSLDLDGTRGVVGAAGAAYIIDRSAGGWAVTAQLDAGAPAGSHFGRNVAVAGSFAVVSAHGETVAGLAGAGAVYVFERTHQGWESVARLTDANPRAHGWYGSEIAVSDGWLLIGAPNSLGDAGGSVEFWQETPSGWQRAQREHAPDGWESDRFGEALDLDGDQAIVGASFWAEPCQITGAAFLYQRVSGTWELVERIRTRTGYTNSIGEAVALHAGRFAVSDHHFPVQFFMGECPARLGTRYCSPALPNSTGLAAGIDAGGSASAAAGALTLIAGDMPLQEFGLFLTSMTDGMVVGPGGSDGVLCLGGQIARFASSVLDTGLDGRFELEIDTTAIPTTPAQSVLEGQTWHYQAWYRDGGSSNFTDAVSVVFE